MRQQFLSGSLFHQQDISLRSKDERVVGKWVQVKSTLEVLHSAREKSVRVGLCRAGEDYTAPK